MSLTLSRKRKRELRKLKRSADKLWDEQRATLASAQSVLHDARLQLAGIAREEVVPRVTGAYESHVKPTLATGIATGRSAVRQTRQGIADEVIPAISGAIGSALAVVQASRDPRVRNVVRRASTVNRDVAKRARHAIAPAAPQRTAPGPGAYVLIGLGVLAAAGAAYAVWQTLRSDDELWVEDLGPAEVDLDDEF